MMRGGVDSRLQLTWKPTEVPGGPGLVLAETGQKDRRDVAAVNPAAGSAMELSLL